MRTISLTDVGAILAAGPLLPGGIAAGEDGRWQARCCMP